MKVRAALVPTPRLVLGAVLLVAVAVLPAVGPPALWAVWVAGLGLLGLAAGLDLLLLLRSATLALQVTVPALLHIGEEGALDLHLRGPRARRATLDLACDLGPFFRTQPLQALSLRGGVADAAVPLSPTKRGTLRPVSATLRWTGPLGLFARVRIFPLDTPVPVVPNTRLVRNAALRVNARDAQFGNKTERYPGEGSEFDALREHAAGMDPRAIHWKASARHRQLLSREFRAERNHQVVLCFDTGRLMEETVAGLSRLDHAIHAGLLLGYFCLRGGDRLGLYGYDVQPRSFALPQAGPGAFTRLLRATAELEGRLEETNHTRGLVELSRHLRRRSLVVIFTEFVDGVAASLLIDGLERLARRHLVLFVTLGDAELGAARNAPPSDLDALYRSVVAGELLRDRRTVLQRLRRAGVLSVDARPEDLSGALLNRYLDIRQRERV